MDEDIWEEISELKAVDEEVKRDIEKLKSDFASIQNYFQYLSDPIEACNNATQATSDQIKVKNIFQNVQNLNKVFVAQNTKGLDKIASSKTGDNNYRSITKGDQDKDNSEGEPVTVNIKKLPYIKKENTDLTDKLFETEYKDEYVEPSFDLPEYFETDIKPILDNLTCQEINKSLQVPLDNSCYLEQLQPSTSGVNYSSSSKREKDTRKQKVIQTKGHKFSFDHKDKEDFKRALNGRKRNRKPSPDKTNKRPNLGSLTSEKIKENKKLETSGNMETENQQPENKLPEEQMQNNDQDKRESSQKSRTEKTELDGAESVRGTDNILPIDLRKPSQLQKKDPNKSGIENTKEHKSTVSIPPSLETLKKKARDIFASSKKSHESIPPTSERLITIQPWAKNKPMPQLQQTHKKLQDKSKFPAKNHCNPGNVRLDDTASNQDESNTMLINQNEKTKGEPRNLKKQKPSIYNEEKITFECNSQIKISSKPDWSNFVKIYQTKKKLEEKCKISKAKSMSPSHAPGSDNSEQGKIKAIKNSWRKESSQHQHAPSQNKSKTKSQPKASSSQKRRQRCKECSACKLPDCTQCRNCKDKAKFGGNDRLRKACTLRNCKNPGVSNEKGIDYCYDNAKENQYTNQFMKDWLHLSEESILSPMKQRVGKVNNGIINDTKDLSLKEYNIQDIFPSPIGEYNSKTDSMIDLKDLETEETIQTLIRLGKAERVIQCQYNGIEQVFHDSRFISAFNPHSTMHLTATPQPQMMLQLNYQEPEPNQPFEGNSPFLKLRKFSDLLIPGTGSTKPTSYTKSTNPVLGESELEAIEQENYHGILNICERPTFMNENNHPRIYFYPDKCIAGQLRKEMEPSSKKTDQSTLPFMSTDQNHDETSMPMNRYKTEYNPMSSQEHCNPMPQPNLNQKPLIQLIQPNGYHSQQLQPTSSSPSHSSIFPNPKGPYVQPNMLDEAVKSGPYGRMPHYYWSTMSCPMKITNCPLNCCHVRAHQEILEGSTNWKAPYEMPLDGQEPCPCCINEAASEIYLNTKPVRQPLSNQGERAHQRSPHSNNPEPCIKMMMLNRQNVMQNQVKPSLLTRPMQPPAGRQRIITTKRQVTLLQETTEDKMRQLMTLDQDKILVSPNLSRTIHPSSAMITPTLREANLPEGRYVLDKKTYIDTGVLMVRATKDTKSRGRKSVEFIEID